MRNSEVFWEEEDVAAPASLPVSLAPQQARLFVFAAE